jgi:hypothetical protein
MTYGKRGSTWKCPNCGTDVSVEAAGRHKGSRACAYHKKVVAAERALALNTWDKTGTYGSFRILGRPTAVLAFGIDTGIDALTVIHKDGGVRQYLSGEWGYGAVRQYLNPKWG